MNYTEPMLFLFLVVSLVGLLRLRQDRRYRVALLGVLALAVLSWPPAEWLFSRPLEFKYSEQTFARDSAEAIVVLAAGVAPADLDRPFAVPDALTFQRVQFAAWLFTSWKPLPLIASGGPGEDGVPFANTLRDLLQLNGVPAAMIWTEDSSLNTHQNAANSAKILREHGIRRIILVVETRSMLRAEACFRKEGIEVIPAPFPFFGTRASFQELMPSWKAIQGNEAALHEVLGLGWYWLRGWV